MRNKRLLKAKQYKELYEIVKKEKTKITSNQQKINNFNMA